MQTKTLLYLLDIPQFSRSLHVSLNLIDVLKMIQISYTKEVTKDFTLDFSEAQLGYLS
jgi:hypothetical protein